MLQDIDITIERLNGEIIALRKQIEQMQKAIVDALYKRGLAYSQQGDRRRALVDLNIVIERDSFMPKPITIVACCIYTTKNG